MHIFLYGKLNNLQFPNQQKISSLEEEPLA